MLSRPFTLFTLNLEGRPKQSGSANFPATENPMRTGVLPTMGAAAGSERSESQDLSRVLSRVFATHPRNTLLSPFLATLPKPPSCKSFLCHTCDPLRPLRFRSNVQPYNLGPRGRLFSPLARSLCFHALTYCPICNSFPLITLQQYPGVCTQ